uniref:Claudin n=1 Tax=Stegastes partitus TaxID=144197 RepID=A0A3B5A193_9TELE
MKKRLIQVFGFLISTLGWLFVLCTMAMDYWRITQLGGQGGSFIIKVAWYWSNLWKDCFTDSTAVTNCRDFPVLWRDIHMCRALIIICIILAFFGSILVLVGMKCTKLGGSEIANARVTFAGGMNYLIGGMCSMVAFSYYGNKIRAEFQDPHFTATKRWCLHRLGRLHLTCCWRPYLQYLCRERRVPLKVKCHCCVIVF